MKQIFYLHIKHQGSMLIRNYSKRWWMNKNQRKRRWLRATRSVVVHLGEARRRNSSLRTGMMGIWNCRIESHRWVCRCCMALFSQQHQSPIATPNVTRTIHQLTASSVSSKSPRKGKMHQLQRRQDSASLHNTKTRNQNHSITSQTNSKASASQKITLSITRHKPFWGFINSKSKIGSR